MAEKKRTWSWLAVVPVALAALWAYLPNGEGPTVTIRQGTIVGRVIDDGTYPKPLDAFMGIPYALPPVDERRFRPAQRVPDGNGTLEAFYLGPRYEMLMSVVRIR